MQPIARDLAEWDAEIEADFRRTVAKARAAGRKRRGQRHVGAPLAFLAEVCRLTQGRAPLAVALLIYRRTCMKRSLTVTLPSAELAALEISPRLKQKALRRLEAAGLIRIREGGSWPNH